MLGIGGFEFFLILLFGFLIFGPEKLPEIAKTVGKALNKFRSAQDEMSKVIKTEVYDPGSDEPFKNPLDALAKLGEDPKKQPAKKDDQAETFAERKARYDRERAAKKAAEQEAAEAAAAGTAVAGAAKAEGAADAADATDAAKADKAPAGADADAAPKKERPSAAELYAAKPAVKAAPAAKPDQAKQDEPAADEAPATGEGE